MTTEDDFRFPEKPVDQATNKANQERARGGQEKQASGIPARAVQLADELRAHARTEAAQGQLSPTDNALMLRIEAFLRHEVGGAKR